MIMRTQPIREDRGPFGRQPTTLGALASPTVADFQAQRQQPATAPANGFGTTGFSSMNGAAPGMAPRMSTGIPNRSHTQPAPGTVTDGRSGNNWGGWGGRNGQPWTARGQASVTPDMLSMFSGGDDATRQAMLADLDLSTVNQLARQYGAQSGMDPAAVINRWGMGNQMPTGTAYTPGMFGSSRSANAWGTAGMGASPGAGVGGGGGPVTGGAVPVGSGVGGAGMGSPGYGVNVSDYLDPSMRFQMDEGLRALENSAAARGNLGSGSTLRDILRYSQGLASTDYGNAFNRAINVRDFTYGVDRDDRNFDYRVASDDWTRDNSRLRDLAGMGLSATQSQASGDNVLSGLIASLINNQGQIQGAGNIGSSNAINGSISQIIAQLLGGNALLGVPPTMDIGG